MVVEAKESPSLLPNVLGSAAAGILSRICTHPLDTSKARLQAPRSPDTPPYRGPFDVLRRTARTEGIRGLYRGFGAVIVGGTPGTVLYLCTYEIAKARLSPNGGDSDFAAHFWSGMIAETVACIIYVPVDVIKERMQVQHTSTGGALNAATNYRSSWDALRQISTREGLSGIYRGYGATLASFGPFSALYFVFYERLKHMTRLHLKFKNDDRASAFEPTIPFQWTVLCTASAGGLASWLTSPLDMAKLRLQVQRGKLHAGETAPTQPALGFTGVIDCLQQSFREGGVKGLFRGAGARVLHFAPATAITMTTYETCRVFAVKLLNDP